MSDAPTGDAPTGRTSWLARMFTNHREGVSFVIHATLFLLALLASYLVRYEFADLPKNWLLESFLPLLPLFLIVKLLVFWRLKHFRADWAYAGVRDVVNILLASWWALLILWLIFTATRMIPPALGRVAPEAFRTYSRGVLLLDFMATVFLACTARLGLRLYLEELRPISPEGLKRVLIVGAGHASETVIREVNRMSVDRYRVVGMVDDDRTKRNLSIHGISVLGRTEDIPDLCQEHDVDEILIAIPSATQKELRRIIEVCSGTKLKYETLPSVRDLIDGAAGPEASH